MAGLNAPLRVQALQDEPIDALVYRILRKGAGAVEAVLAVNPNLADLGPRLPRGTTVVIPVAASGPVQRPMVQLWS